MKQDGFVQSEGFHAHGSVVRHCVPIDVMPFVPFSVRRSSSIQPRRALILKRISARQGKGFALATVSPTFASLR